MLRRISFRLGVVGILLIPLSCTPVPGVGDGEAAAALDLPSSDEVPQEWGSLVAVSPGPGGISLMWFEDDSGAIRIVIYDFNRQRLWEQAVLVRRR